MERNQSVEARGRNWLNESGYDYEVRTYQLGETAGDCVERDRERVEI